MKYFDDVDLVFPSDEFQVGSFFNMFTRNKDKPWMPVTNMKPGFDLVFCECIKDPTNLKLVRYLWLYSA